MNVNWGYAAKAIAAALTAALSWGYAVVASSSAQITASEWMILAGVGVTFVTTFFVPNTPANPPPTEGIDPAPRVATPDGAPA